MIFAGLIFVGLALVLLGVGFLGASAMKGGVVKDAVEQIGVVKGIGAGFLYGGGVVLFIGFIMGAISAFGL